jgi:type II secretory pathway pseudopilin PulG
MFSVFKSKKGTGIVEIIAGTIIFLIAAGAGTEIISYSKSVAIKSSKLLQATVFTQALLEHLITLQYRDLNTANAALPDAALPSGDFKDKYQGTRTYAITEYDASVTPHQQINPIDDTGDYKRVQVTSSWDNAASSITFTFYKTNPNA